MQVFEKEHFRFSEKIIVSGLKSSLTYWKIRKRDRIKQADYVNYQLIVAINAIENIIQNKKD